MNTTTKTKVAAVQIKADLGNVDHNLEACERQAERAAADGAAWIALPEFFSTGVAFRTDLSLNAAPVGGEPTKLLSNLARRHGIHVGGSTLVRDEDGHVRNAFLLAAPDGKLIGRHDKDLPTMWENALYVGGTDPGRIQTEELTVGVALCWELIRAQTVARLADQVALVLGGSGWWSIPRWPFMRRRRGAQPPTGYDSTGGVRPARRRAGRTRGPCRRILLSVPLDAGDLPRALRGRGTDLRRDRKGIGLQGTGRRR